MGRDPKVNPKEGDVLYRKSKQEEIDNLRQRCSDLKHDLDQLRLDMVEKHKVAKDLVKRHGDETCRLLAEIEAWKDASGLERGGDPDGVTPEDLRKELARLRKKKGGHIMFYVLVRDQKRNEKKSTFADAFETMSSKVHETAREKGWWSNKRGFGEAIALMHSELSEALEAERRKNKDGEESKKIPGFTKVEEELADVVIRIMDWAKAKKLRVGEALEAKNEYNKTRTWKHGGKAF